jgi:hypothetical protein
MSAIAKGVGNVFVKAGQAISGKTRQAVPAGTTATASAKAEAPQPAARMASPEEKVLALRRRRGSRALLSQERVDAEAGLGGQQTTLGGM